MKKIIFVSCMLFSVVLIVGIVAYSITHKENYEHSDYNYKVEFFDLNKSSYCMQAIQDFPSEKYLGETLTAEEAVKKAVSEWYDCGIFSEKTINRKPYCVFYDRQNAVWYITGSVPENVKARLPHILIQKTDGKVLAVWGD